MLTRRLSSLSALAVLALLPVAAVGLGGAHKTVSVGLAAKPVTIGVSVTTAMQPLDLRKFGAGDFGDVEAAH